MAHLTLNRKKSTPANRSKPNREIYGSYRWRTYSNKYLSDPQHRLCLQCKKEGRITIAKVADHIIPINHGGEIYNPNNHQPLCISCHNTKSAKERHHSRKGQ